MITKAEWQEWKESKVTQQFVELLYLGNRTALDDLKAMRGEVGDYPRGAADAYLEAIDRVKFGEDIYSEVEK